ncbi:ATP-binding cassette domain-containing protein [Streptomyces malaysiense]|uniref:ABC-type xenobiotic transporter n=1 Tax=Streptomyces malaysiense TaxID=1428626 RepID=A0A1J4Q761_9ACTN|nr:ATP-binding cassette domain-containing protein [Streptomyces malaysiense]OIK28198.1 ABC transporter [Streptomyces malaysiense]
MTTPPSAITVTGLSKSYGDKVVLDGIDLEVAAGSIFSLLGPNGAGKTTTVEILTTLIKADAGEIRVAGKDVVRDPDGVRGAISVTGQFSSVDNLLTGRENLIMMADLHHLGRREARRRADELLEQFDLAEAGSQRALAYSGGMRRRLDLAMTLVRRPAVIFLDEPTTGLDPRSRHAMWDVIRNLVSEGVTIFLTTQYLEEADQLADLIAVLDQGRLVAQGTATELKRRVPGSYVRLEFAGQQQLERAQDVLGEARRDSGALALQVPNDGSVGALRALLARLEENAVDVAELTVHTPDLDDVFLALTTAPRRQKETAR